MATTFYKKTNEMRRKKIFKPKHLVNTINHRSNNTLIVISQNLIKTSDKIVQQLNNLNLKKTSIKTINTF